MKSDLLCSHESPFAGHFSSYQKTLSTPDHSSQLKDVKPIVKKKNQKTKLTRKTALKCKNAT